MINETIFYPARIFFPVFELRLDSLSAILVESHQCPPHQSILLIQGPIHEIATKKNLRISDFEKINFYESAILFFVFKKKA
jgi:hypothetical protein